MFSVAIATCQLKGIITVVHIAAPSSIPTCMGMHDCVRVQLAVVLSKVVMLMLSAVITMKTSVKDKWHQRYNPTVGVATKQLMVTVIAHAAVPLLPNNSTNTSESDMPINLNQARFLPLTEAGPFSVPPEAMLAQHNTVENLKHGDFIKVKVQFWDTGMVCHETFWVQYSHKNEDTIYAIVSNDLHYTQFHGISDGELVEIEPIHILATMPGDIHES